MDLPEDAEVLKECEFNDGPTPPDREWRLYETPRRPGQVVFIPDPPPPPWEPKVGDWFRWKDDAPRRSPYRIADMDAQVVAYHWRDVEGGARCGRPIHLDDLIAGCVPCDPPEWAHEIEPVRPTVSWPQLSHVVWKNALSDLIGLLEAAGVMITDKPEAQ